VDGRGLLLTGLGSNASLLLDQLWSFSYPDGEAHMISNYLNSYSGVQFDIRRNIVGNHSNRSDCKFLCFFKR